MSRMRALTGARPTRSRSSSSITAPAWLCASTSLTVRAAPLSTGGVPSACVSAAGAVLPGMEYSGVLTQATLLTGLAPRSSSRIAAITAR